MIKKISNSLYKNTLALYIYQGVNALTPFVVYPILTNKLSVDDFSIYVLFCSLIGFFSIIIDYGFLISTTYYIARNLNNKFNIDKKISIVLTTKLILYFSSFFVIFLISYLVFKNYYTCLKMMLGLLFVGFIPMWFYRGIQKMWGIVVSMIIEKLALLTFVYFLVDNKLEVLINYQVFSYFLSFLISYFVMFYFFNVRVIKIEINDLLQELKEGKDYYFSRLSVVFYTSFNVNLIGFFNPIQAAVYAISENFYKACISVTSPLTNALFPYMAKNKDWKLYFKQLFFVFGIVFLFSGFLYYYIENLINYLFPSSYSDVVLVSKILIITSVITYLSINLGYSAFSALGRNDIPNRSTIIGCVVFYILFIIVLIFDQISAKNLSIIFLISEVCVLLYRLINFLRLYESEKANSTI